MTLVLQLLFLLFCLVTTDSSGQKTEDMTLTLIHNDIPDKHRDEDKAGKLIRCAICKKLMKGVMCTVSQKIHQKLSSTCNSLIPSLRKNCYKYAVQLGEGLIHVIFPGRSPYIMCKIIDMCR